MGAAALALAALEVAVGRRRAALPRRQLVGVHAQAHRAAGVAPFGAEVAEDLVEPLGLGLQPDAGASRGRPARARRRPCAAADDLGGRAQVLDPAVGAGADEDRVDRDLAQRRARPSGPCTARARSAAARAFSSAKSAGTGTLADSDTPWPGLVPQVTNGSSVVGVEVRPRRRRRRRRRCAACSSTRRRRPSRRPAGRAGGPSGSRRWSRRGPPCRRGRRPRSTCCRWSSGLPWTARGWPRRGTRARSPGRRRCRSWR